MDKKGMTETEALRFYKEAYLGEKSRGRALTKKLSEAQYNKAQTRVNWMVSREVFSGACPSRSACSFTRLSG